MSEFGHSDVKIRDFIASIKSGKYQLPCFQRDFRWNPAKIKSLINSIQHEYPAGSLLFLKVNKDDPLIPAQGFKYSDASAFTEKPEMLVLDGQQRMTSCFSVFTNAGYYTYYINFVELMKQHKDGVEDFDFETLIVHKRHNPSPFTELVNGLFPISFLIDRNTMRNQIKIYVSGIQADPTKADICEFLNYTFGDIVDSILDYEFPIVELPESSSMEAVCKVFQTINTTGLKLSVFDICVAVFMPKGVNLKEKVGKSIENHLYVKQLIEKDATVVLQVVALLANKAPNSNTLAKVLDAADIVDYWDDAIDGIEQALILFDSFGAGTKKNLYLLPYTPMVPIVAAVLSRTKYTTMDVPTRAKAEQKIKTYFYTAALSTRYTEGTNAKINDDYKALKLWISSDDVPTMIAHGVDWNTEKIVENNKNGAFGKAVLCMLNSHGLRDFYANKAVGIGENIESCDLHHIFPKAQYESNYPELINSVFNFTWLLKDTNIYIKDEKTCDYLTKILMDVGISESQLKAILESHHINDVLYSKLKGEEYIEFIDKRAELFKQLFMNAGVQFTEVAQDDLEVEQDEDDNNVN